MASTVLPNGIIIPEKYSRDWYNDLYHNWEELDNLLSASTPGDGTLTIQKNGDTVGTFTANSSSDKRVNISVPTTTSELTNDSGFITEDNTKIPLAGSNQISGSLIPATTNTYNFGSPSLQWNNIYTRYILIDNDIKIASSLISKTSNSGILSLCGGISNTEGASISLYGKEYSGSAGLMGNIYMTAYGNSDYTNFCIYPNGIIRVYNNSTSTTKNVAMQEDVVPRSGGAVMTGDNLARTIDSSLLKVCGGTAQSYGGIIALYGKDTSTLTGYVVLQPSLSSSSFCNFLLSPDGSLIWGGQPIQYVSDQRLKQQISQIDNALLDAWENVTLCQFKYNDAVNEKGTKARFHTGYVVQQINEACQKHDVNISDYGLYCHEEYHEETEEVEVEQEDGTIKKETKVIHEASEHYSLRYTEVYAVECMYLRRCIARLTARIEELEKRNNTK